jgi:hypothetical protein
MAMLEEVKKVPRHAMVHMARSESLARSDTIAFVVCKKICNFVKVAMGFTLHDSKSSKQSKVTKQRSSKVQAINEAREKVKIPGHNRSSHIPRAVREFGDVNRVLVRLSDVLLDYC